MYKVTMRTYIVHPCCSWSSVLYYSWIAGIRVVSRSERELLRRHMAAGHKEFSITAYCPGTLRDMKIYTNHYKYKDNQLKIDLY